MTTNTIDLSQPVATIIKEHPEVKELLIDLGFKPLSNPAMLNTVGKVTSLKAGSKLANIPLDKIKQTLLSMVMTSSETNMENNRIQILKEILLDLHHGASPESVQERFNQHFKGVSALEISMMEHELMSSEDGVTFEDVMSLCNVHANLFKGAIADVEVADADQEGHPVYVFKQENLALRSAILRIRRIIENISKPENEDFKSDLFNGLKHQMTLLGQFHNHYTRKEKLFFPIMERYGHDSPPKVMWGVDDDIRKLFRAAEAKLKELPDADLEEFSKSFEAFSEEFEAMIFKEEAILLMILLETFTQDDWLSIAEESDAYGYAIIKPTAVWKPKRERFEEVQYGYIARTVWTEH